ncbi:5-oxoprolinase/urea amidolyase family protein [Nibribacter ruber]|uniref:5-oxoprolinase/urea amidolyase family protein n=1 Tax=Nibribacter ruber TaxID=2698458 RepID=A0A6P1NVW9_9BACT|nr:biotin-dependent carboxyltransferase family protein [Nibribacter ruber]QHL85925.1 5-oxoprolinase/urea amidolyase family protein [Nibribacter ruber]
MGLRIEKPGLLTTVQDTGRLGHQKEGVLVSGAMDAMALRMGNLLVGNHENSASLEMTLLGPTITFTQSHLISITGADLSPKINGEAIPLWRPVLVKAGAILTFGTPIQGTRSYLNIAGGLKVEPVLGSASTYLKAGFGGWQGKVLQAGIELDCNELSTHMFPFVKSLENGLGKEAFYATSWRPSPDLLPAYEPNPIIRAVRGPEYDWFSLESKDTFWQTSFQLTAASDRMGYQLEGEKLELQKVLEMLSTAVTFGTVQVPSSGNPIVLMADHQTTGGYPRIAQVITADYSKLAQVVPGRQIQFQEVTLEEAQFLYLKQEQNLERLKQTLSLKFTT